jgi:predicted membrane protein
VLSFEGSALNTPSLFYTDRFVPAYNLIQFLVAAVLFYLAVFVLFKRRPKKARGTLAFRPVASRRSSRAFPKQQEEGGTPHDAAEG